MKRRDSNTAQIARETADLVNLLESLPKNPLDWGMVVRLIAPIIARLAVRMALKRTQRSLGEDKVNLIGSTIAGIIRKILTPDAAKQDG